MREGREAAEAASLPSARSEFDDLLAPRDEDDITPPPKPKRERKPLTFIGVIQELFLLITFVAALFAVWFIWGDDFIRGHQDNAAAHVVAEQWSAPDDMTLGWLGDDNPVPVTVASRVLAEQYGVVYIPRFGEDYARALMNGTEIRPVLNQGSIGHYDDAQDVGEIGNFAAAGHRSTYGAPLNLSAELKTGDPVVVQTEYGYYVYRVAEAFVTDPSDIATIFPVPGGNGSETPTQRWMTLTTCHPIGSAEERFIVHAIFDEFIPAGQATPTAITEAPTDNTVYVTTDVPEVTETAGAAPTAPVTLPTEIEGEAS